MTATRRPLVLLRPVPGNTVIHQIWAGTKLIVVFLLSLLLSFYPGWLPIAMAAAIVGVAAWLARVPRGALPSVPVFIWVLLLIGGLTAGLAGGAPVLELGSVHLGIGGFLKFLRFTALSVVLLALGAMVSWTTNVADVAPAISKLWRPLRALRIPVDDWAVALALALRAFPMLMDEFRLLYAARRLRPRPVLSDRRARRRRWVIEMVDLMAAGITVALRRADEMGDAVTARGGTGQISAAPSRPGLLDWVTLTVVGVLCVLMVVYEVFIVQV
jgi:energy-coupling factor transport system permease protein